MACLYHCLHIANFLINLVAVDLRDIDFDYTTSATVEFHTVFENIKGFFLQRVLYYTHLYSLCGRIGELYIFRFYAYPLDSCVRQWMGKRDVGRRKVKVVCLD